MSTELPPINRPESALSKRTYSRESLTNIPSQQNQAPPSPGIILPRQERQPLLTIDCNPAAPTGRDGNQSPYSPTRRSRVSPGSQNSNSSTNSKGYSSQNATSLANSRNKSWATSESTGAPKQPLETLFEQNKTSHLTNGADSGIESYDQSSSNIVHNPSQNPHKRNSMKPPQRQPSYHSSLANATLAGKRATSTSNLTRTSDNSSLEKNKNGGIVAKQQGQMASLKKPIQRIRSENNVLNHGVNNKPRVGFNNQPINSTTANNNNNPASTNHNMSSSSQQLKGRSFNRVKSQPELIDSHHRLNKPSTRKGSLSKHLSGSKNTVQEDSAESEEERERIVQWLVGVERADTPPMQEIIDDEPVQTDTAIHVVYNGD